MKHWLTLKKLVIYSIAIMAVIGAAHAVAQIDTVTYPVAELDGCENEVSCKAYCDEPTNIEACLAFAESHGLMEPKEIAVAKNFVASGEGPGGCEDKDSCKVYCNDINNIDECVAYAEENDILPPKELEEAKQVQVAMQQGLTPPGGCTTKTGCDTYCNDTNNIEECITFAEKAGLIPTGELEEAKKVLRVIKETGIQPPPCRGEEACNEYCEDSEKLINECIPFAVAAGFMTKEEAEMVKKTGGKGPGGCKGKEECEAFCENPDNEEICFKFGEEHGILSQEDRERMKEGMQQFKEGLEQAPSEVKECLKNKLGEETLDALVEGTRRPSRSVGDIMKACFDQFIPKPDFPPEVEQCLKEQGIDFENMESQPPPDIEKKARACFEKFGGKLDGMEPMEPGNMPEEISRCLEERGVTIEQLQQGQPPAEAEKCFRNFKPPMEMMEGRHPDTMPAGFTGPDGCSSPEECKQVCEENPEACKNFAPPHGAPMPENQENKGFAPEFQQQFQKKFQKEFQEGFQEQFRKEFQDRIPTGADLSPEQLKQLQQQFQNGTPPEGFIPPEGFVPSEEFEPPDAFEGGPPPGYDAYPLPEGEYGQPPEDGYAPPQEGEYAPPPDGDYGPPPDGEPPPPPQGEEEPPQSYRLQPPTLAELIANIFITFLR